jgi:ABC-2 type transport system ATP-binding protein
MKGDTGMTTVGLRIEAQGLVKRYGECEAVKRLDLDIEPGDCFGLIGPNGAGKTTTMSMLTGLLLPTEGSVRIGGEPLTPNSAAVRRRIGVVPDQPRMFERLRLDELLSIHGSIYGLDPGTAGRRAEELLALLQLEEASKRPLAEYSHGMRKRAAFALAVLHDPGVVFLDEPFEGLDPIGVRVMLANLRAMARAGRTVFVTSHILGLVERLCTRVAILDAGRIAWQGTIEDARVDASAAGTARGPSDLEALFLKVTGTEDSETLLSWVQP